MKKSLLAVAFIMCAGGTLWAQNTDGNSDDSGSGGISFQNMSPTLGGTSTFDARFSMGFNYDLLRPPTQVSFDYPRGFIGFNIPLEGSINPRKINAGVDSSINKIFRNGDEIKPIASARQNPSTTIRVDVPMLGGVGTFANMQNVYISYMNTLGIPSLMAAQPENNGISMAMRGAINVPLDVSVSWETMVFGYAYKVNKDLTLALNLNRHVFRLDARGDVNVDLLGYVKINQDLLNKKIGFDYTVAGVANANYSAEPWSATLAAKYWRVALTSRFGMKTRARGSMNVDYTLPFFIDKETFQISMDQKDLMDIAYLNRLEANETSTFTYHSNRDMTWEMPSAYTLSFDIVRDRMNISYTKLTGKIKMGLDNVWVLQSNPKDTVGPATYDTFNLQLGLPVDNIIMISGNFKNAFFNLGVFGIDCDVGGRNKILSAPLAKMQYPMLGGMPLFPVLNFGSALGTKMQLLLEIDVLPLMALKSGVVYYF